MYPVIDQMLTDVRQRELIEQAAKERLGASLVSRPRVATWLARIMARLRVPTFSAIRLHPRQVRS